MQTVKCLECLPHFPAKTNFFSEGTGVCIALAETPERWLGGGRGDNFCVEKLEIPGRRGGSLHDISSVVGVWIFSGTTQ